MTVTNFCFAKQKYDVYIAMEWSILVLFIVGLQQDRLLFLFLFQLQTLREEVRREQSCEGTWARLQ